MINIPSGIWPTMITPFTSSNKIDYTGIERLVEWYISKGVNGIFAMCQSSEMFYLTLDEKVSVIKSVLRAVNGRVPVIASGHTSYELKDQIKELSIIADTGIDALVLITNLLATDRKNQDDFKSNAEIIRKNIKHIPFGLYECPYPYKFLISNELLEWCASAGGFIFLKDTCCDIETISERLTIAKDSSLKIYNANSATLLKSLELGAAGFSGVMANFHPEIYKWLYENYNKKTTYVNDVHDFISCMSNFEYLAYPQCAKYYLKRYLNVDEFCRKKMDVTLSDTNRMQLESLRNITYKLSNELSIISGYDSKLMI